jgi:hypothetical protein
MIFFFKKKFLYRLFFSNNLRFLIFEIYFIKDNVILNKLYFNLLKYFK